jgi:hypothetical protein
MTWAKVDDHANEHRKQLAAGAEACWLWTCGLMYANRQAARDGFIPDGAIGMLYPFKSATKLALKLVEVRLWHRVEGGYLIHEFTTWNQTKEQREHALSSGRERAARSYTLRAKNQNSSGEEKPKTHSEENTVLQNSSGSTPTPTPLPVRDPPPPSVVAPQGAERDIGLGDLNSFAPDPPPKATKKPRKKPSTPFPDGLEPLPRQLEKCRQLQLNCADEFEKFSARHQSTGALFADWHRAFDTWIQRAPEFRRPVAGPGTSRFQPPVSPNVEHESRRALQSSRRVQDLMEGKF